MDFEKVKEIIVDTIDCDEDAVTMEANIKEDLGMDSLDAMELSMAIEEGFDITIEEDELQNFVTVKDIVQFIESKIA